VSHTPSLSLRHDTFTFWYGGLARIDRIGSDFPVLWVYNMFPEEGLERLLRLVESLSRKINDIDRTGFLDVSILGEIVHPQNFNTLRRIMGEDGKVVTDS